MTFDICNQTFNGNVGVGFHIMEQHKGYLC